MSYHILHLLSPHLKVRLKLDQLHITDAQSDTERTVPLSDVAVIVVAAQDAVFTAGALRRMAELNVLLMVCNEKYEPCALTLPYYRPTNTDLLRRQMEWTLVWKNSMWQQIITAKILNQATNLAHLKRAHDLLVQIAQRCERGEVAMEGAPVGIEKISLSKITPSQRTEFLSHTPAACESRAARHYWKHLLPRLSEKQQTEETTRDPGTHEGVNGMLDYGYAIIRTAVLRSLAAHGFIAAIGINHAAKAGSFALADDLVEPLRPWMDKQLRLFLKDGARPMKEWMPEAVSVLQKEVNINKNRVCLLNAIDLYVQSFAQATLHQHPMPLKIPMLP